MPATLGSIAKQIIDLAAEKAILSQQLASISDLIKENEICLQSVKKQDVVAYYKAMTYDAVKTYLKGIGKL